MGQHNNNNQNDRLQQNRDKDQPHKMAPDHDNRPKEAQDNNQGDKTGHRATDNTGRNNR
jgi:hypothetical protein